MYMQSKILITPIDNMVEFISENKNCSINTICSKFNLSLDIIEKWLVILEEYKILEVKYAGFEGFANINPKYLEKKNLKKEKEDSFLDLKSLKLDFIKKVRDKDLQYQAEDLWPKFISNYEPEIKENFYKSAKERGFPEKTMDSAWNKFKLELLKF